MSSKATSPTAQLLRSSRLFSLPTPISQTQHFKAKNSPSATAPYPTQQAIKTTSSARARGDWGLKRPLPLQSTNRTNNPIVRVHALDTNEHITDFSSAADLTTQLAKFHELGLAITTSDAKFDRAAGRRPRSVFEDDIDNVDLENSKRLGGSNEQASGARRRDSVANSSRWKFDGPWLASLTEGDFVEYLDRKLKGKKPAFMAHLREVLAQKLSAEKIRQATERGDRDSAVVQQPITSADVTEEQMNTYVQNLRKDFVANSELARLLESFFDLPSTSSGEGLLGYDSRFNESGPPTTHPSAGLSYLRSDAYMANHPLLGPQKFRAPVEARNLGTGSAGEAAYTSPFVGIGGFVAKEPGSHSIASHLGGRLRTIAADDTATAEEDKDKYPSSSTDSAVIMAPETEGRSLGMYVRSGNRVWVTPTRASIDSGGRVKLTAGWAAASAVNVRTAAVLNPEARNFNLFNGDRDRDTYRPRAGLDIRRPAPRGRELTEDSLWGKRSGNKRR